MRMYKQWNVAMMGVRRSFAHLRQAVTDRQEGLRWLISSSSSRRPFSRVEASQEEETSIRLPLIFKLRPSPVRRMQGCAERLGVLVPELYELFQPLTPGGEYGSTIVDPGRYSRSEDMQNA